MTWRMEMIATVLLMALTMPATAQDHESWSLVRTATIGGAAATGSLEVFENVTRQGIAGRADGHLFVLDQQGRRVLEFDGAGRPIRALGREGDGPGEFRFPVALAIGPGDSLWVYDSRASRFTVFAADGESFVTRPVNARGMGQLRVDTHGVLLGVGPELGAGAGGGTALGVASPEQSRYQIGGWSHTGRLERTVWTGPMARREPVSLTVGNHTFNTRVTEQYAATTQWDVFSDGILVVVDTAAYLVRYIDRQGNQRRAFRSGPPPRAVTEEDRAQAVARFEAERPAGEGRLGSPAELRRRMIESMPFAAVIPRIAGLAVDGRDHVWLGITGDDADDVVRIDVLDRNGRRVAVLRDAPMPDVLFGGDRAARVGQDEYGAQQIIVYRIAGRR